jgi:hypothetical protein
MRTLKRTEYYTESPGRVFDLLDDLSVTGMHMTNSSMAMMGSKLDLQFLTEQKRGYGTKYRWTGTMMWMKMDFTVDVTKWVNGQEKVWETIGEAKLIIYTWFRMNLILTPTTNGTKAELSITYKRPEQLGYKILSFLFADLYCWWCLRNMMQDTQKLLSKKQARGS